MLRLICDLDDCGNMKRKLTKRVVEALQPGNKDIICWDSELPGFGVKVTPRGRRVYFLYYRTTTGRERRPTIGRHGQVTCEEARRIAGDWHAAVRGGGDPGGERRADRASESFAEFADRYMTDYAIGKKKSSTLATDGFNLKNHLLPALGQLKVGEISRADVVRLHQRMKATPGGANRTLYLLSHMLNVAERWGLRPDGSNPCRHVEKFNLRKRERFLSEAELGRLAAVLTDAEETDTELPSAIAAIRLLLFTGARLSEILSLRWEYADLEAQCLRLPDSKTGAKTVYLPPPALEVLAALERREDNPYVIPGAKPGAHLVNLQKPWRRIRKAAGLEDVRIHDLRHSFASMAVAGGLSLPVIGALLGHSQPATTARYAHLADDPLRQAANIAGGRIAAAMQGSTRQKR
jgi:integrase